MKQDIELVEETARLPGEGDTRTQKQVRVGCHFCGEPADRKHSYVLPDARRNPRSSGYGKGDISWCSDRDFSTCSDCYPEHKHPDVDGYEWCSTFSVGKQFAHMFLEWETQK